MDAPGDWTRAWTALTDRLWSLAAHDEALRGDLRTLAQAVLALTDPDPTAEPPATNGTLATAEPPPLEPLPPQPTAPPALTPAPQVAPTPVEPLRELTLGRSRPPEPLPPPRPTPAATRAETTDADLPEIEAHCRLKAEGIRWAGTRQRLLRDGADFRLEIAPRDQEHLDRGRALACYLWMNTPEFVVPDEPARLEDAVACFETMADALGLVRALLPDIDANRAFFEPALDLMAEVQSALRVAIDRLGRSDDQDQFQVYNWLRDVAARERIYIPRYMRLADPADPANLLAMRSKLEEIEKRFHHERDREKRQKAQFKRLRYHAKFIAEGTDLEHNTGKVVQAINDLANEKIPPSNLELREILLPILECLPDLGEPPQNVQLVLRELDRYLASLLVAPETAAPEMPAPEVVTVARLLEGKTIVLIGGQRRPAAQDALRAAFRLKRLVWIETREHESIDRFEADVARPEVALVLLAIRWSSHSFGEVKRFCDRHGKPMVRLPGGYGVNQVAVQIARQCSEQLAAV